MTAPYVDRPVVDVARAEAAARRAADDWSLPEPELLRRGMNVLYRCGGIVIRVGRATAAAELTHELARRLSAAGVPVVHPLVDWCRTDDGFAVTAWEHIDPTGRPIDWREVGRIVRRVHELGSLLVPAGYPTPDPTTFPWWRFDELLAELDDHLDAVAASGLAGAVAEHGWALDVAGRDAVLCHGDVHPGNVIDSAVGLRLIDWDLLCRAAPAWDHAMLITYEQRWGGEPWVYDDFAEGYGRSFADDPLALALGELRNVAATLMRVRAGLGDRSARDEAERRLRYWRHDPDAPMWRAR